MNTGAPDELQEQAAGELAERDAQAEREYNQALPELERTAAALKLECESLCKNLSITPEPVVRARVKDWKKLLPKVQNGVADPWDTCTDLIGVRIVALSSNDVDKARTAVQGIVLDRTEQRPRWYESGPRSKGYQALHVAIQIPEEFDVSEHTREVGAELQIVTALQDAWGAFSHDDFYKSREGVPFEFAKRALRLAAVMDLADDEIQTLRDGITEQVREDQKRVTDTSDEKLIKLDEVTLIAAAATTLRQPFIKLRQVGRSAGFQVSGFPELVKPGFEADIFLRLAAETKTETIADLRRHCEEALSQEQALREVVAKVSELEEEPQRDDGAAPDGFRLFDRPLQVLQASMMLKPENENVVAPLKGNVARAIAAVKNDRRAVKDDRRAVKNDRRAVKDDRYDRSSNEGK